MRRTSAESHSIASSRILVVFMRYPQPGRVKSRLAEGLGAPAAAAIYDRLLRRTLGVVADFRETHRDLEVVLFFDPADREADVRQSYPGPWRYVPQPPGHLGERMRAAFDLSRNGVGRHTVVIGSDIGDLECADLGDGFSALELADAVVGPAHDGGFYLIGLRRHCDAVFAPVSWGGATICRRTLDILRGAGLKVELVSERSDVDRADDLIRLRHHEYFDQRMSIIIPFLGPVSRLTALLESLEPQLWAGDEIVVAAGGESSDQGVVELSVRTRMVYSPKGRGQQLNRGVQEALGDLLWFLHADSTPTPNFAYHVRKLALNQRYSLGCFRLAFCGDSRPLAAIARWANWRTEVLKLPYGDQGIFCRRSTFEQLNGFRRDYIMEDVDFVRSARRLGKLLVIPQYLHTSPARYLRRGILQACLTNHLLLSLYLFGVSERRIYSWYYRS